MSQQNVCLACGRVISGDEPGICNVCAEFATEVQFPVLVRQVVPETSVINPEDLRDTIPACPYCHGEREPDGLGGYACYFCGRSTKAIQEVRS